MSAKDKFVYVILDKRETVLRSWAKDSVTFSFLLLCIYVSQGSTWWTFFTASMFIFFSGVKLRSINTHATRLRSKTEAVEWAQSLSDDDA